MKLAEKVEEIAEALEMFPLCVRCGERIADERLRDLVVPGEHPRRFAHRACPALHPSEVVT